MSEKTSGENPSDHLRNHERGDQLDQVRLGLRADCDDCFGLCCVATFFTASAEFALNKPAGQPCVNLRDDHRCGIHSQLRERGFSGCTTFDCLGAGQKVSQHTFKGADWRQDAGSARRMFLVFPIMRQLHKLLWHLAAALDLPAAQPVHSELRSALDEIDELTRADSHTLFEADVPALRRRTNALLARASELARTSDSTVAADHRSADLVGANLAHADLRRADLCGALLMGADLKHADLRLADVRDAALLDADLRGADLRDCVFLTRSQLDAARGDSTTRLSAGFTPPAHWTA